MNITVIHPPPPSSRLVDSLKRQEELVEAIRQTLMARQECCFDSLVVACSSFTWNQVFSEVDRMSRSGELRLTKTGRGTYSVSLSPLSAR